MGIEMIEWLLIVTIFIAGGVDTEMRVFPDEGSCKAVAGAYKSQTSNAYTSCIPITKNPR
jgi:hypothetical protein